MGADPGALAQLALLLQGSFFAVLLLVASVLDIRMRIIPDSLCLGIALAGLLTFEPVKLSGIFVAVPFLLATLVLGGMGGGDIKLMAAAGLVRIPAKMSHHSGDDRAIVPATESHCSDLN